MAARPAHPGARQKKQAVLCTWESWGMVGLCSKSDPGAIRTGSKALQPCQENC